VADVTRLPRNARTGLSTEHPPVYDETIASYAPFSASLRRFQRNVGRPVSVPATSPQTCLCGAVTRPTTRHRRRTPSNRAIPFTRTCVICATTTRLHARTADSSWHACTILLPREIAEAMLNYARCCALLSFRHREIMHERTRTNMTTRFHTLFFPLDFFYEKFSNYRNRFKCLYRRLRWI